MNNEPVAWAMFKGDTFMDAIHPDEHERFEGGYTIPLYLHQYERPHNTVLVPCDKLAEMQAEIALLKKEAALQRLSDFTQEYEHKPVAYIDPYDLERLPHYDCHIGSQQLKNGIPLYTHPVKELTDEEILAISNENYIENKGGDIDFAKAILRKAQE